ncbi:dipeptidase [Brachybacterium huguangmaarense]|uniref:Dipeptidase n=1 Tax=Brachybacterium huguangmaarense TaxID=1652028 RepID=A0ABY6G0V8_9MICO|nr:dipeptidase [Brachybacterium huguangmaarense]UYG16742.1 dipeptidase [Brachybacterium huguangmaarense]
MSAPIAVVDGHNDLAWELRERGYDLETHDISRPLDGFHTDLPRLRRGGVRGQFWSVYVPSTIEDPVTATLEQIDAVHALIERFGDDLHLATRPDDLAAALDDRADGPIASMLGAEGGHAIGGSLGALRCLHRLGVRYMTLTHNENTAWADSATDEPRHGGLTEFGRAVVAEMNRLGMLVDLSHVAETTMRDALAVSQAPVIFSHSSCRAVRDQPRNVPDDVLAAVAAAGGTCMITFVPRFVSSRPSADLEDVVGHLEHAREVAGIDHIGLGGDYDGTPDMPRSLEDVSCYPRLFEALRARRWSEDDLARLGGRNILATWREADTVAARLHRDHPVDPRLRRP